jgi:hypothetical protein
MLGRVALLLVALALPLALAEAGLRLAGFEVPQFHERDDLLGLTLKPGAHGTYTEEGRSHVAVNSAGMRDVERARAKPAGVLRIAVLGDSYTEALQVERERSYPALLEQHLASCAGPVEVLNFGVSGFGTAQQLLTLRSRVWDYAPDVVLLAVFPSNDVANNSRALEPDKLRPFYVLRDGELVLDDSFRESRRYRLLSNPVYRFLRAESRLLMLGLKARKGFAALDVDEDAGPAPGLDWLVFRPPASKEWADAWDVTERLVATIADEVAAHGATFALTSVPEAAAVHPDRELRRRHAARIGMPDFLYAEQRLGRLAGQHRIAYLPLTEAMDARAGGRALHGFGPALGAGHWNEDGHRLAAELMGEFLCGMGLRIPRWQEQP